MKKSEMSVGLEVEQKRGREYPNFTTGIIILGLDLYDSNDRWSRQKGGPLFKPARPGSVAYDCRRGIPCAVRQTVWGESDGEPMIIGYEWKPDVFRSQELVPVGSEAAYEAERQAGRERQDATKNERDTYLRGLQARSGVSGLRYATGWQNIDYTSVTLSIEDYEKLISRLTHDDPEW